MIIADSIIKRKLENVYFIRGNGKTTAADILSDKYGIYVYHTDNERSKFFKNAVPEFQPAMCREVDDYWSLPAEEALEWEKDIVREFTPMVIADIIGLSVLHEKIICEGDIDASSISGIYTNAVFISYNGKGFDFFSRPEQAKMLDEIKNRNITPEEKEKLIKNAYDIVNGANKKPIPEGIKIIARDDSTEPEQTAEKIAEYFGFGK